MSSFYRGTAALAFGLCLAFTGTAEAQLFERAQNGKQYVRSHVDNQVKPSVVVEDRSEESTKKNAKKKPAKKQSETKQASYDTSYNTFQNSADSGYEMISSAPQDMGMGSYSCDSCGPCFSGCCNDCFDCCGPPRGICDRPGQFFFGAEYIYARASFSEALAYVITDSNQPTLGNNFVEFDFDYQSSYRFYGGYRMTDCDAEIVFNYGRFRSDAAFSVVEDGPTVEILSPYEIDPTQDGTLTGSADVEIDSYDLGVARTIRLGCPLGCCLPCCDTCCGDTCCDTCCDDTCCGDPCCGKWCPAWDITWSAGVRFAEAGWDRTTTAFTAAQEGIDSATTRLSFDGAGARIGLLGRRYFGCRGWLSAYARGDISLLVGNMNIQTVVTDFNSSVLPEVISHRNRGRRVIPVTEIEAGLEAHIGNHLHLSSGYFISAWHDLGMRDTYEWQGGGFQLSHYDDANILGFDGLFARAEITY